MHVDVCCVGMGVATVNAQMDGGGLAKKLRVSSVPSVVGLINGKPQWYSKQFNIQNLRDFVRSLFPEDLIMEVVLLRFVFSSSFQFNFPSKRSRRQIEVHL